MINRQFDPNIPYRFVVYGRMSSDRQNPRSPDQQFQMIKDTVARQGYGWVNVGEFRDDGISGRYSRKRSGFQRMLNAIMTGILIVDLILVDSLERFGRMENLLEIRRNLQNRFGILILTADTNFSDPTSTQGRVFGAVESIRSSEAARVKAHDVWRGKRDAALLGHWPGGPAPFGLRLKSILCERKGRQEVDYSVLEHDPESGWIMQLLFEKARDTGWGQTRLARFLTSHPDIDDKFKPFEPATVGYLLANPIYNGTLRWNLHATDVVDDAKVTERNDHEDVIYVPNFCEPLVSQEIWDAVQALRRIRRERIALHRQANSTASEKQMMPLAPGMVLKYPLTGLVRCGDCGRSMDPSTSSYTTTSGTENRYVTYVCPGYLGRNCDNNRRVPEPWLRGVVAQKIRERLFADQPSSDPASANYYQELLEEVGRELRRRADDRTDPRPAMIEENAALDKKVQGWTMTLGNPEINGSVRRLVEEQLQTALLRQHEIAATLAELDGCENHTEQLLDPQLVQERLARLEEILVSTNPTLVNLELSLHIDRIDCYQDGRVIMRTCRLGAIAGAIDLLGREADGSIVTQEAEAKTGVKPRRRARLRVDGPITGGDALRAAADMAADPNRFAGLDDRWFWLDEFQIPARTPGWAAENAERVFLQRQDKKQSFAKLAVEFGVKPPTIGAAIRRYVADHPGTKDEVCLPCGRRGPRVDVSTFASEAKALWLDGWSKERLAAHYGYSAPVIDKALAYAYQQEGLEMPTRQDLNKAKAAEARRLLDGRNSLEEIAKAMNISDTTARKYLRESFDAEGKPMPDLRRRRREDA